MYSRHTPKTPTFLPTNHYMAEFIAPHPTWHTQVCFVSSVYNIQPVVFISILVSISEAKTF